MEFKKAVTGFVLNENCKWENAGEGVRRKITGYDNDLMMVIVEFKKGAEGYLHNHPHKQTTYVAAGSFKVNINGEKKILSKGDVFFVEQGVDHGVVALEEGVLIDVFNPCREDFLK